ncbi:MAG: flagellar type III secretion system pore protein FliP [Nitrospinaceae bacterium]|nr:flagellar type III secretion system pore protein FliP [Nitrospinaceae bacterium]
MMLRLLNRVLSPQLYSSRIKIAIVMLILGSIASLSEPSLQAQTTSTNSLGFNIQLPDNPQEFDLSIRIVIFFTLLAIAPSLMIMMTCFTRIVIVLSFLRTALALQQAPSNQLLIAFSLFLTFFIMGPVFEDINESALIPYSDGQITSQTAIEIGADRMRTFMLKQTRPKDVEFFLGLARVGPTTLDNVPLRVVIPSFVLSELTTAFQMGFFLFLPFILIDFVVAIVLMSLGLMFLPPTMMSMPMKLLLFVLVDGWTLLVKSLVDSFNY